MSLAKKTEITCPRCGTVFEITVWDSVNTGIAWNLPEKIISGEFFWRVCPKCGTGFYVENSLLYHDLKRNVMIWFVPKDEDYEARVNEIRRTEIPSRYRTRIVHTADELGEKVAILEADYDDRIVEVMKCLLFSMTLDTFPDLQSEATMYIRAGNVEYIRFLDSDGKELKGYFDPDTYQKIKADFSEIIGREQLPHFAIVDRAWGLEMIGRLFEMKRTERENREKEMRRPDGENDTNFRALLDEWLAQAEQEEKRKVEQQDLIGLGAAQFCRKCGAKLVKDSIFCHECGEKIVMPTGEDAAVEFDSHEKMDDATAKKIHKRSIALFFLAVALAAGALLFGSDYLKVIFFL